MGLAFFGLNLDNLDLAKSAKLSIYKQIHQICFHGQGGYNWNTVYNMPVYLRNFIFNEIKQYNEEQNKQNNQSPTSTNTPNPKSPYKKPPSSTTLQNKKMQHVNYK